MPTHVTNIIEADKTVLNFLINKHNRVDFSRVIPLAIPFERDIEFIMFSALDKAKSKLKNFKSSKDVIFDDGDSDEAIQVKKMIRNKLDYGYFNWVDFAEQCWGVDRNAYYTNIKDGELEFQSSNRHPFKVIETLSLRFPSFEIKVSYASENLGFECGEYTIKNGKILSFDKPSRTDIADKSWIEFAFDIVHSGKCPKTGAQVLFYMDIE